MSSDSPAVLNPLHLSVVVPVYNEAAMLLAMAEQLAPHFDDFAGRGRWQFVLVDNGSTDSSAAICAEIVRRWPGSVLVELDRPNYGEALCQGLAQAAGPWAFIINVDFWDVPFMRWCFRTRGVYDLVVGSKRADFSLNRQQNYRKLLSWGLNTILQAVFGFVGSDTHGQKFVYLPVMRPIFQQCVMRRGQFDTEFTLRAARAQLWIAEVPVPHRRAARGAQSDAAQDRPQLRRHPPPAPGDARRADQGGDALSSLVARGRGKPRRRADRAADRNGPAASRLHHSDRFGTQRAARDSLAYDRKRGSAAR